jgi:hypothetical protein
MVCIEKRLWAAAGHSKMVELDATTLAQALLGSGALSGTWRANWRDSLGRVRAYSASPRSRRFPCVF